jgi:membrane protein DedA with SNARE-associated domain
MWQTLAGTLLGFVQEWGEVAIFLVYVLEEAGVPLPLPGDLIMIWAGYRVATGQSNVLVVLLAVELATVIGASGLFWLGLRGGRPLIVRYGRVLQVEEALLLRAEGWVGRNATMAVFLGRVVPGFRIVTPLAAGVFRVPYRVFLPPLMVGTLIDAGLWLAVGFYVGPSVVALLEVPQLTARLALSVVLLAALALLTWQIHRRVLPSWRRPAFQLVSGRTIEAAALAGLLATLEMATGIGIILTGLVEFRFELPERALLRAIEVIATGHGTLLGRAFVPVAALLFFLAGILWSIVYAVRFEPRLSGPPWLKGAVFSLLPTVVSWFVVLPLLGAGPLGLGLGAGLIPAVGELVRHLLYGAALGLAYPMLLLARRPWEIRPMTPSLTPRLVS